MILKTTQEMAEQYNFPETTIRYWLLHRRENGLDHAVVKVTPKKLYIDELGFAAWLRSKREVKSDN